MTGTKPVRVQGVSGECSWSYGLVLHSPVRSRLLDSTIFMGPFQLEIFYHSNEHLNLVHQFYPNFFIRNFPLVFYKQDNSLLSSNNTPFVY